MLFRRHSQQVALVIKTHRASALDRSWQLIQRLAQADSRLHLVQNKLPRPELMALYAACDVFVSLHRAEGFGRNIAEALLLGLDVIATDHGGNVDFRLPPLAHLVESFRLPFAAAITHTTRASAGANPAKRKQPS